MEYNSEPFHTNKLVSKTEAGQIYATIKSLTTKGISSQQTAHTSPCALEIQLQTRKWANAQRDGRPAEYRWRPVLNAAKFGSCPLLECRAVMLPIGERKT